ncbi:hypothetical protein D9619_000778 [Psilocybe cf. subviscida]|uniref:J domain-containing protein n=1 Tax=Psilocybe cf. subviscida TaxID=2480587 RepID=A0A8H5BF33_9AGAR|nr:hypothetical protein D9619_000778 [Psilocybe cf. subviscida]
MKLFALFFAFLAVLFTTVSAWEKEDHEIFDIVHALEEAEGKGTTFYSWLDLPPTATTSEIAKAYRKKSITLHPDKNPEVKNIHERFARLGVISSILRNQESRKRYDFFYKNGVPKWRGTGYYYSRYRPGLGAVLFFLTFFTSGLQYTIQKMNYKRDLERIEYIVEKAKAAAWGPKMVPIAGKRKVRVGLGGEGGDVSPSKFLDLIVEDSKVYLLEPSGDMHPLDASTAAQPSLKSTWAISTVLGLVEKVTGKKVDTAEVAETAAKGFEVVSDDEDSTTGSEAAGSVKSAGSGRTGPTSKAGGMRRKNIKRK